ncbi:MAG: hypothetical protein JHC38_04075 [Thiotrichales bacterium]|nr:hypothetical protein [Thiotrichales bacterium]
MDVTYSKDDFVNAVYMLLPTGDYWSKQQASPDLKGSVEAIGGELYQTYLDNKQSFLYQADNNVTNWRIADYQTLLDSYQKQAIASDNQLTPNVIDITIKSTDGIDAMLLAVIDKLLPHTVANFKLSFGFALASSMRLISYQRIEAIEQ